VLCSVNKRDVIKRRRVCFFIVLVLVYEHAYVYYKECVTICSIIRRHSVVFICCGTHTNTGVRLVRVVYSCKLMYYASLVWQVWGKLVKILWEGNIGKFGYYNVHNCIGYITLYFSMYIRTLLNNLGVKNKSCILFMYVTAFLPLNIICQVMCEWNSIWCGLPV